MATATSVRAAETVALANGGFEDGLTSWSQRGQTVTAAQIQSPGTEGKNFARLEIGADAPAFDRVAIYLSRRDLPMEAGSYRIHFAARSELTQGRGGARVVNFGADKKVISAFAPGAKGVPLITGTTPWTQYSYVYVVPPDTKMIVLQLDGNALLGTMDYDAISIEKLTDEEAKALAESPAK